VGSCDYLNLDVCMLMFLYIKSFAQQSSSGHVKIVTYMNFHKYVFASAYLRECMCVYMVMCVYVYVYRCWYVCVCMYVYMYVCIYVCV
jgi:hypothetical protein